MVLQDNNQLNLQEFQDTIEDEFSMRLIFEPEQKTLWGYHKQFFKLGKLPLLRNQRPTCRAVDDKKFDAMPVGKMNFRLASEEIGASVLIGGRNEQSVDQVDQTYPIDASVSAIQNNEVNDSRLRDDISLTSKESSALD